jgi:hypothetical protein
MDIQSLRKMRSNDFGQISSAFDKIANPSSEKKSYADDRFWKLQGDKAGNGTATIRFLPRVDGDELPWVRIFSHGFQGPTGKWYIENSLTTLSEKDPVSELNSSLWNSGVEANKKIAQKQKRRLSYIANILVVSDPKHPENEGKVFLFKFGKKIFDKVMDKARPTFEDEQPVNVFDFWDGANFKMRMRKKDGFTNYDESIFTEPCALGSDEDIVKAAEAQVKLSEFTDTGNFKSYDDLKRKLDEVLSGNGFSAKSAAELATEPEPVMETPQPKEAPAFTPEATTSVSEEDDGDVMAYFSKIANDN